MSASLIEEKFAIDDNAVALALFGHRDENLRALAEELDVRFVIRGNVIDIWEKGAVHQAQVLADLLEIAQQSPPLKTSGMRLIWRRAARTASSGSCMRMSSR